MRTLLCVAITLGLSAGCTRHNPASCCVTPLQCEAFGLGEIHLCEGIQACDSTGTCVAPECASPVDCPTDRPFCENQLCVAQCAENCTQDLSVTISGSIPGHVTSTPSGIDCMSGTCTGSFPEGSDVQLAVAGGTFLGWSNACTGFAPCSVRMDQDRAVTASFGMPGDGLWVTQIGGPGDERAYAMVTTSDSNLIAVGYFSNTIQLGSFNLISPGASSAYVVKLDSNTGSVLWAKGFGGASGTAGATSVAIDPNDNIYITGTYSGTVDFGNGHVLSPFGSSDVFVAKLDSNGEALWANGLGNGNLDNAGTIAVKDGQVAISMGYRLSIIVNGTTYNSAGLFDVLLVSFTTEGTYRWVRSIGGSAVDRAFATAIDAAGNVVVAGGFDGTVDFGGGPKTSAGQGDVFVATYTKASGAYLTAKLFGSAGPELGTALVVDGSGNMIVAGAFSNSVDFGGPSPLTALTAVDIFVAKYSAAGAYVWARSFGGSGSGAAQAALSLSVNAANDVAVTGNFCGSLSFGGPTLSSASACPINDVFAVRLASGNGNHINSARAGGAGDEYGQGVTQTSDGRFFVSGRFSGFADMANHSLVSMGGDDVFVLGLAPL